MFNSKTSFFLDILVNKTIPNDPKLHFNLKKKVLVTSKHYHGK